MWIYFVGAGILAAGAWLLTDKSKAPSRTLARAPAPTPVSSHTPAPSGTVVTSIYPRFKTGEVVSFTDAGELHAGAIRSSHFNGAGTEVLYSIRMIGADNLGGLEVQEDVRENIPESAIMILPGTASIEL